MLARRTGCRVAFDMRAADVAAGGQGAPLVPVYHGALAASLPERPVAFLNIGGVANVTWIGADGGLLAFDTGPGNALLNDWCLKRIGAPFDEGGRLAASGKVDRAALAQLLGHGYFEDRPPKSLDRNSFAGLSLDHLSDSDGAATLLEFTRASVLQARDWFPEEPRLWVVCGGGRRNLALMDGFPGRGTLFRDRRRGGLRRRQHGGRSLGLSGGARAQGPAADLSGHDRYLRASDRRRVSVAIVDGPADRR